jgi:death-on-curing protein
MKKPSEDLLQPNWLKIDDFEFICFNLARELMSFGEPIPDYSTRDNSLLESSLAAPINTFHNTENATLVDLTAVLFYSLIKNHPFSNGNKRIAVITILIFLRLNDKWLDISPILLYQLAVTIANSLPKERDSVLSEFKKMFYDYVVDYGEFESKMEEILKKLDNN